jgi:hypothetical protein
MNKFVLATVLAVSALAIVEQRAGAWTSGNGCIGFGITIGCPWGHAPALGGGGCCAYGYPSDWFSSCYGWPTGCDYGNADMGYHGYPTYSGNIPYTAPSTTTPYTPPAPKPVNDGGTKPTQSRAYPAAGYQPVSYYPYPPTGSGSYQAPTFWYGR